MKLKQPEDRWYRKFFSGWRVHRVLILFMLTLFLSAGLPSIKPVLPSLSAPQLVEQGRECYAKGQFNQAVAIWQEAVQAYESQGDELHQAMALTYLYWASEKMENWSQAKEALVNSFSLLEKQQDISDPTEHASIYAQALNARGNLEITLGQPETALKTWQQARKTYQQLGDVTGVTGSLINQAQALEALGFYRRTCKTLLQALNLESNCDLSENPERFEIILQTFKEQPNAQLKVLGLRSLGNILRLIGDLDHSQQVLEESLQTNPQEESATLLSLGKTERAWYRETKDLYNRTNLQEDKTKVKQDTKRHASKALEYYQQVVTQTIASSSLRTVNIEAQLHRLSLLLEYQQWFKGLSDENQSAELEVLDDQINEQVADLLNTQITELPPSRTTVYAQLNFARSLNLLREENNKFGFFAFQYAQRALQQARELSDKRSESYALGTLGKFYGQQQQWLEAKKSMTLALVIAQGIQASDLAYQWQWQLGRIYQAQGETQKAIVAYKGAVQNLDYVRKDLQTISAEVQFSFRDDVEPVYRELVDLLLREPEPIQEDLIEARKVVQNLQLAELENFLKCSLPDTQPIQIDNIVNRDNSTEAVIYPIILEDRIEIMLKLPFSNNSHELRHYSVPVARSHVNKVLETLQKDLTYVGRKRKVQQESQEIYQWLIEPLKTDLESSNVNTLVFFLDAPLQNIPMAVLYDGQNYLIEKYAVALTSGLQLPEPKTLSKGQLKAILAGLTKERLGFPPLGNVQDQFEQINDQISSEMTVDEKFTVSTFQDQIKSLPYSVVHIATHGNFSSDPQETFILAWDNKINVNNLKILFQSREQNQPDEPIELLVLAACETSQGDKRATLGIAGIAINSGARSTIATLWKISADKSPSELFSKFYKELKDNPNITKAEALRRAQLQLLKHKNWQAPYYWAPYILSGNWL